MSNDNNGGGFGLFIFFAAVAGIVMVMNPIEADHLSSLATDLGDVVENTSDASEGQHIDRLGEMVEYKSYYLWSVTSLTSEAADELELEEELVMSVGAVGRVWSPVDLQVFGARYDANMKVVHEGVAEALEVVTPETINEAERIVGEKVNAAMEGAADVVAEGAASAAAITDAANEVVKQTIEGAAKSNAAAKDGS